MRFFRDVPISPWELRHKRIKGKTQYEASSIPIQMVLLLNRTESALKTMILIASEGGGEFLVF